ncbi:MAG: TonB-dependent receptor plug domain-containing protein [Gemmatimonadota bacterium]|nr:TonB-dependent receptor plug domain-containing protein [Gemmatimonadota bacterium]
MRHLIRTAVMFATLALVTTATAEAQRRDRNLITAEEIAAEKSQSILYEIVKVLRPQWFRASGARQMSGSGTSGTTTTPVLYIDGVRMDSHQLMNSIPPDRVKEVKYLSPRDAHLRYGMGHEAGVIEVSTTRVNDPPPTNPPAASPR